MQTPTPPSFDELSKTELIEQLKVEKDKNEAYFRLITDILHEFRNPVGVMFNYFSLHQERNSLHLLKHRLSMPKR